MCAYPLKELAVSVPGPVQFTSSASADGGGGARGGAVGGLPVSPAEGHPSPAFCRTASLYIIYIYVCIVPGFVRIMPSVIRI